MKKGIKEITKKLSSIILMIIMILSASGSAISSMMVYAAETGEESSVASNLPQTTLHAVGNTYNGASGNRVTIDGATIWDYYSDDDNTADYYCLKGHTNINYTDSNYYKVDLVKNGNAEKTSDVINNIDTVPNSIAFKGDSEKAIKSLQWLAKNMYNVKGNITDAERNVMKNNLQTIIKKYGEGESGTTIKDITEEQIGIIQQFVVWQFVEHTSGAPKYYSDILTLDGIKTRFYANGVKYYSDTQATEAYAIYKSLLKAATDYGNGQKIYSIANVSDIKGINMSKTGDTVENVSENKYCIGPIKVTSNDNSSIIKNIEDGLKITGVDDVEITKYKYDNTEKTPSEFNILNVLDEDYYVEFTTTKNIENKNIQYSVIANYKPGIKDCDSYIYLKSNVKQPILGTRNTLDNPKGISKSVKYTKQHKPEMDIALTKKITKIEDKNGKEIQFGDARLVDIDNRPLANNEANAIYTMNKNALLVSPGDVITYELTVYNEGINTAYVKEITDFIPTGLTLIEGGTAGTPNNGYTPITIQLNDGQNGRRVLDGRNLQTNETTSTTVTIKLKVEDNVGPNTRLMNIAEVTSYGELNGDVETEANKDNVDTDSIEKTINNAINYQNMINNNIGVYGEEEIDKNDLVLEDDEDFEIVQVGPFDLALRKFITKINGEEITESRKPMVSSDDSLEMLRFYRLGNEFRKINSVL